MCCCAEALARSGKIAVARVVIKTPGALAAVKRAGKGADAGADALASELLGCG